MMRKSLNYIVALAEVCLEWDKESLPCQVFWACAVGQILCAGRCGVQSVQGVLGRLDRLKLEWPSSTEDQIWTGGAGGGVAKLAARFPWTGRHLCAGLLVALAVAQIARLSLLASG